MAEAKITKAQIEAVKEQLAHMEGVDVNSLTEEELRQLAVAYLMDDNYDESGEEETGAGAPVKDSDVE